MLSLQMKNTLLLTVHFQPGHQIILYPTGYSREKLFLVSKVYPHNAGCPQIYDSIDQTLHNLKTDYLDMYLLHWRGSIPLEETVDAMEELVKKGKIRSWGVSNLDKSDMKELFSVPNGDPR